MGKSKSDDLNTALMNTEVRSLLDLVDGMRSIGVEKYIQLPQIAVVGDQSSGKSSVLEAISGIPFPRGSGLVTKCATEIRMKKALKWKASVTTTHPEVNDIKILNSPDEIDQVINKLTNALVLKSKNGFSDSSIVITVESPNVEDLTIIDLPGIVRTTTAGQNKNVIEYVDALLDKYIIQDRTVLLAVVPSNQDVATVEVLERARAADKVGERTIGVLTKPDLINPGGENEVVGVLQNQIVPLNLGYVMVRNRSQDEINEGISLNKAKKIETEFFKNHKNFQNLDSSYFGVENLMKKLSDVLLLRIRNQLPSIKREMEMMSRSTLVELKGMGSAPKESLNEKRQELSDLMNQYKRLIYQSTDALYMHPILSQDESLHIYQEIIWRLINELKEAIADIRPNFQSKEFCKGISKELLQNQRPCLPGFLCWDFFQSKFKKFMYEWEAITIRLITFYREKYMDIAIMLVQETFKLYPTLKQKVYQVVRSLVEEIFQDCEMKLNGLCTLEQEIIITFNSDFLESLNKNRTERINKEIDQTFTTAFKINNFYWAQDQLKKTLEKYATHGSGEHDYEAEDMALFLSEYWRTSENRFVDNVNQQLVFHLKIDLFSKLEKRMMDLSRVYIVDDNAISQVMQVDDKCRLQRKQCLEKKKSLEEALLLIGEQIV